MNTYAASDGRAGEISCGSISVQLAQRACRISGGVSICGSVRPLRCDEVVNLAMPEDDRKRGQ